MEIKINGNELQIYLEGSLTTTNATEVEEEINKSLSSCINKITFDGNKLDYISSAGLRVILGLAKKIPDTSMVNASRDVYDVFEMTGFLNFIKVSKRLREISVDGCKVIGEGANALVYRLNEDTIVKAFKVERTIDQVKQELDLAKKAFIYGIPTAISYDIVRIGDKLGVVFEMIDASSLCDLMIKNPSKLDEYIQILVSLLTKLKETDASNSGLRDAKEYYLNQLDEIKDIIPEGDYYKVKDLLHTMKEEHCLVHGDFHIKNIMIQNGEPILIDMDTVSVGNQIFEFGSFYIAYYAYNQVDHNNTKSFFGLDYEICLKIYKDSLKGMFKTASEEEFESNLNKIEVAGCIRMLYFCKLYKESNQMIEITYKHFKEALDKISDLNLKY